MEEALLKLEEFKKEKVEVVNLPCKNVMVIVAVMTLYLSHRS